ncbi:MAG: galactosyltransferase-related protein [Solirubrobacteraceae bacterium]|nr:galactosyltransferase-related protein [Solirubrobacteraceae bacterium]
MHNPSELVEGRPSVAVVVPRRTDNGPRDKLWEFIRQQWLTDHPGWPLVEGFHHDGPFNRATAINRGANLAPPWDVLVIADADTLVPKDQAQAVAALAIDHGRLTLAYERYVSLTHQATQRLISGGPPLSGSTVRWTMENSVSGCLAVPRVLWLAVGGFDERFVGWGYEDRAFFVACDTLGGGHERVPGNVQHLWHPRPPERSEQHPKFRANRELCRRYKHAHGDRDAIRSILAEREVTSA